MQKLVSWVKTHKLLTFNILVVGYFILQSFTPSMLGYSGGYSKGVTGMESFDSMASPAMGNVQMFNSLREAAPQPDVTDRKVVTNSNFSLLVKDVVSTLDQIKAKTLELSGYVVSYDLNKKEYGDSATLQMRVPSEKIEDISKFLRSISVKVVSEKITGTDITDQYIDLERRISDLERQRVRMEEILASADTVSEMLEVQRGLFQIQDQIDVYKGKILYMDGTTKTSKLTVYISTDELSLPYTPDKPWRPDVIFKQAVRSMLGTLQDIGSFIIWVGVYSPLIVGAIIIIKIIRRRKKTL